MDPAEIAGNASSFGSFGSLASVGSADTVAGGVAGQVVAIGECIQTHYWNLEIVQFVLVAAFGAALYGFVNEMAASRASHQAQPPVLSR